jgi:methyl-accepting chemotaxis protein
MSNSLPNCTRTLISPTDLTEVESLQEETQKSLKEIKENTSKHVKELSKTIQDLKIETLMKTQRKTALEMENLGNSSGVTDARITNTISEIEERISDTDDNIEDLITTVRSWTEPRCLSIDEWIKNKMWYIYTM